VAAVDLNGVRLRNRLVTSASLLGYGASKRKLILYGLSPIAQWVPLERFGAVTTRTLTVEPREGRAPVGIRHDGGAAPVEEHDEDAAESLVRAPVTEAQPLRIERRTEPPPVQARREHPPRRFRREDPSRGAVVRREDRQPPTREIRRRGPQPGGSLLGIHVPRGLHRRAVGPVAGRGFFPAALRQR